jgi:hypothetical protein
MPTTSACPIFRLFRMPLASSLFRLWHWEQSPSQPVGLKAWMGRRGITAKTKKTAEKRTNPPKRIFLFNTWLLSEVQWDADERRFLRRKDIKHRIREKQ